MINLSRNLPFIIVFICLLVILFISQFFSSDSQINILNIFRGPLKLVSGSYYVLRDVSRFRESRNENKVLRENISSLQKELLDLREANLENERLRKLLGFKESKQFKFVPAMIIAKDPSGIREAIIIDKGKKDNVRKDMSVISGRGLVGRVRECGFSISRVLLITDSDSVVSGIVERSRDEGAVLGNGRAGLIMKYLELESGVKEGDEVISSGFGGVIEKGILIGRVVSVEKDASGLYLNALVRPEVDIAKLEEVLVIR